MKTACAFALSCLLISACARPSGVARARVPVAPVKVKVKVDPRVRIKASVKLRVRAWKKISLATKGTTIESKGAQDVPVVVTRIFDEGIPTGIPVDVVFVVDTTGSMHDDIDAVKQDMRRILDHLSKRNPDHRIGIVAYRDITDEYLTRTFARLTDDHARIHRAIAAIKVRGGEDWREHVYAGINTALYGQPWRPQASQHIILMGDAPPHEDYHNDRRNYDFVTQRAQTPPRNVRIHTIGIKCDKKCEDALARGE